jgi:hypothetical protein
MAGNLCMLAPLIASCMFAIKLKKLYNSTAYDTGVDAIWNTVKECVLLASYTDDYIVASVNMTTSISFLKHNKHASRQLGRGSSTNHFRFACTEVATHMALLFSGPLTHGTVSDEFLPSTTIPIPKGRNANLTTKGIIKVLC